MAEYDASSIRVLDGLEAIRMRPGMYVGDTRSGAGMRHLLWEAVGNAVDESLAGRASTLRVTIEHWTVTVEDDGGGIPVVPPAGAPHLCLESIFTRLFGGSRGKHPHVHVGEGLIGLGGAAISALSDSLEVEVTRDGRRHRQVYARGRATTDVLDLGPTDRPGTRLRFTPDLSIFAAVPWDLALIGERLWHLACLNPSLAVVFNGRTMRAPHGLAELVRRHAPPPRRRHDHVVHIRDVHRDVRVEVALCWTDGPAKLYGWASQYATTTGSHVVGLWKGLARALTPDLGHRHARELLGEGLVAAVHADLIEPRFGDPCRERLDAPEAESAVQAVVDAGLRRHVREDETLAAALVYVLRRRPSRGG